MEQVTFGAFLKQKRLGKEYTLRGFAEMMGVSPVYLCDVEKDRKPAPSDDRLKQIIQLLLLDKRAVEEMYDLAALSRSRPAVSNDLTEYIMGNHLVRDALRKAKEAGATDEEWLAFIEGLNGRVARRGTPEDKRWDSG